MALFRYPVATSSIYRLVITFFPIYVYQTALTITYDISPRNTFRSSADMRG